MKEVRATIYLFLTSVIWGVSFVAQVVGMDFMRPFTFNGVTFLIGAVSLAPVIAFLDKKGSGVRGQGAVWRSGLICGIILFCAANFQQFGVELTGSAGKSGFITGLYIIIVPLAGIFMKQKAGLLTWIGAVLAAAGMYFLCVQEGFGRLLPGDWLLFVCAFFWAAHIIAIDKFAPHVNPLRLSQAQFFICGGLCLICALFTETIVPANLLLAAAPLLYRGLGSIGLAYTLQIFGQRHVAPANASVIFSLESVFSVVGGAILISEIMTPRAYLGCALIFAGIILSQLRPKKLA